MILVRRRCENIGVIIIRIHLRHTIIFIESSIVERVSGNFQNMKIRNFVI